MSIFEISILNSNVIMPIINLLPALLVTEPNPLGTKEVNEQRKMREGPIGTRIRLTKQSWHLIPYILRMARIWWLKDTWQNVV